MLCSVGEKRKLKVIDTGEGPVNLLSGWSTMPEPLCYLPIFLAIQHNRDQVFLFHEDWVLVSIGSAARSWTCPHCCEESLQFRGL